MKKLIFIIFLVTFFSCERVGDYECVCYDKTDTTKHETYRVKNKRTMAESYCKSLSMPNRPCNLNN